MHLIEMPDYGIVIGGMDRRAVQELAAGVADWRLQSPPATSASRLRVPCSELRPHRCWVGGEDRSAFQSNRKEQPFRRIVGWQTPHEYTEASLNNRK